MLSGTNIEAAHFHNQRVVLETVRIYGPLSRADISRRTALSSQTISNSVDRLLDLAGTVHQVAHWEWSFPSPEEALPRLVETVQTLTRDHGLTPADLWGVGLAVPGPLDLQAGCLEMYVSLASLYAALETDGRRVSRVGELSRMLAEEDAALMVWLVQSAERLTRALVTVENPISPRAVIFGGRLPAPLLDWLLARLEAAPAAGAGHRPRRRARRGHPAAV